MKQQPINIATAELTEAIRAIEPSLDNEHETIRPCCVVMKDGTVIPRAFCRENARYSDKGEWIDPAKVAEVRPSEDRIPVKLARTLYAAGESGMGYVLYTLVFRDGRTVVCTSGGLVDFPALPDGYRMSDAVEVRPHEGRERTINGDYCKDAEFSFLDYVPHDYS